eukprot:TRINITY_DN829_c0_g1_i1.p1 TRINITY_DN829_c0_g1~~TRINITY_DN829_c0_g1_i1.p1  ORF type:complete len:129 (+),score=17.07 TRINITY_DN829_c0_g1_i1:535-921(+)
MNEYFKNSRLVSYNPRLHKHWEYVNVVCLGFLPGLTGCPHYHGERRDEEFSDMIQKDFSIKVGIALDDGVGLLVKGNEFKIIIAKDNPDSSLGAFKLTRKQNDTELGFEVVEERIKVSDSWASIKLLY